MNSNNQTNKKQTCYRCNGNGYTTNLRFTGAVVHPFRDTCTSCSRRGYTEIKTK